MPELPEVEIVRRGLTPAMLDKHIKTITLNRSDLRGGIPGNLKSSIQGARVITTLRRGKYIMVFTEGGAGFVLHLGMSGRIKIHPPGQDYAPAKHDHVIFTMDDNTQVIFNDPRRFGMLYSVRAESWQNDQPFASMGPEPLDDHFTGEKLAARLRGRRTPIKSALLDQKIVAGIGNIYACEALFESAISPFRLADSITPREAAALAESVRGVLLRALASGGSSLKDYRHTDGNLGYFQHSFSVYDREGLACPGCDCDILKTGGIQRIVQAGRSTFHCPRKQNAKPKRKGSS